MKIIFGGGAWKLFYFLGVIKFLQENIKLENYKNIIFQGASAGSWTACIMALQVNYKKFYDLWLNESIENRKQRKLKDKINTNKGLKNTFKLLEINNNNINTICNHVGIYTTNLLNKQTLQKNIDNEKDLYNILMGSTYLPFFGSKKIPKFHKEILLDGELKKIKYDSEQDIFISSVFNINNHDVSPSLKLSKIEYLKREFLTYYPPSKSYNENLFKLGYKNAQKLLQNPKFIQLM